jgi:chemotaxis protein CheX
MTTALDIVSIIQNILRLMLELDADPCKCPNDEKRTDQVTGCIQISGAWQGAIVIQSSVNFASTIASRLFGEATENLSEADLRDAFCELANMVGGNIKGLVPGPSFLSIPSVTTGLDFDFRLPNAILLHDIALECDTELLRLMMFQECQNSPNRLSHKINSILPATNSQFAVDTLGPS